MKKSVRLLVISSLLAAFICVATLIVKIPTPFKGYVNLGDCLVLLSGWMLPPVFAFFSAAIGSALADLFAGYAVYIPATFLIKGLTAISAYYCCRVLSRKLSDTVSKVISGVSAETVMVFGYYVFEGCIYGFVPSLANVFPNIIQGAVGLCLAIVLMKIFSKTKIDI